MPTKDQVLDALATVKDPELHRSLTDLDMIKDVEIADGRVTVTVALTISGCPLKETIEADVTGALEALDGVHEVAVELTTMSPEQRAALVQDLHGERAMGSQRTSPLLQPGAATEFIAVASGKGGVGKTTATINLAVALHEAGFAVGLLDCDMYGASVPSMLGIDRRPTVIDHMILPVEVHGVKVISMAFFMKENRPVIWRGPMLGKALRQFFTDVYWGEPDFLLLDLPPGTGDVALDIHELLPQCKEIIVTTPHPTATHVAYRAGQMAIQTDHEILGVLENMSFYREQDGQVVHIFGQGGGEALAEQLGVPLLGQIPLGNPTEEGTEIYREDTEARTVYREVARRVQEHVGRPPSQEAGAS